VRPLICHDGQRLGLCEQVLLVPPVGRAACGADQPVEHLHREVGQRRLALDGKGDEGGEAPVGGEAQQLARGQDARRWRWTGCGTGRGRRSWCSTSRSTWR
jgi:hypothetical protein